MLAHYQSVNTIQIVTGYGFQDRVAVALVKGQRSAVVDRSLKQYGFATFVQQARFSRRQQRSAAARALGRGQHIDGKDMAGATGIGFGNDEAQDEICLIGRHQSESTKMADEGSKFAARIGEAASEALLINAPEFFEIFHLIFADSDHRQIVSEKPNGEERYRTAEKSSTSRTFLARPLGENGLARKLTPGAKPPSRSTARSV